MNYELRTTNYFLMIFLGLLMFSIMGVMLVTLRQEKRTGLMHRDAQSGLLYITQIAMLKERLDKTPQDQALKLEIRRKDLQIRQEYMLNRRRFKAASYLLIITLALWIAAARWYFALAPGKSPEEILNGPPETYRPGHGATAVGAVAAILFATLAGYALLNQGAISFAVASDQLPVSSGQIARPSMTGQTTTTQATAAVSNSKPSPIAQTPAAQATMTAGNVQPSPIAQTPAAQATAAQAAATANHSQLSPIGQTFKDNWPCFRGPDNIGVAGPGQYPTSWNAAQKQNIAWQADIPINGKGSPIVWGDRLFISGGDAKEQQIACFERKTGKLLWKKKAAPATPAAPIEPFESTGFAAPTPATDGRRVYAIFANGILAAFDFAGNQVWIKNLGAPESSYGFASSLILYENNLILQFDQGSDAEAKKSKLLAFDPATGNIRWSVPRPVPNSWASPALIRTGASKENHGQDARAAKGNQTQDNGAAVELVTCAAPWIIAYNPLSGGELWKVNGLDGDVAASPAFGGGLIFISNDRAKLLAIRPGGKGDVSATRVSWTADKGMPDIASPVTDGRRLFQVSSGGGSLTCFNAANGKLLWEQNNASGVSSSPILAGGLVYLTGEDGVTQVIELGDKFQLRSKGEVGEPVYATPAFADSRIYIRGDKHLFCVGAR